MPSYPSQEFWDWMDGGWPSQTHKLGIFQKYFDSLRELPGDFAEFGVFNGNGSRELARLDPSRHVWAFDTYHGMPLERYDSELDSSDPPGKWKPREEGLGMFAGIPNITPVVGDFNDTLHRFNEPTTFLMVHVDCDWYSSYRAVLAFLNGRMTPGGIAFLDDYSLKGARKAVDEFVARHPEVELHVGNGPEDRIVWRAQ